MLDKSSTPCDRMNARSAAEGWPTRCDATLAFEDQRLAALLAIWREAGGGRMPRREDFTARMLGKHLQHLTFVEMAQGRYRFRLFGTALARFTGDWTGKFLEEAVPEVFLPSWRATYDTVVEACAPLRFTARFRAAELEHIAAETLAAPLAAPGAGPSDAVSGLLVSVAYAPAVA
jgi:hypothetical protein